jgi:hypothetical protein
LILKPASHKSFAVDSVILSGMDCCAVCEFFDGYLCRGEESPLYKRDVDPTAKCPAFVRQVAAVESLAYSLPEVIVNGEESDAPPIIEEIDLDED